MDKAIDISNYTGELTSTQAGWIKDNYNLVIVRLSTEDNHRQREIASQQVAVLATYHIAWQGYLWCYWDDDPFAHWQRAQELLPPSWPSYHKLGIWLDMEDACLPASRALTWINSYASLLRADGFVPGVYTGQWWVDQHRAAFIDGRQDYWSRYPVWWANYGIPPACRIRGTAPWLEVAMHQYASVDSGPMLNSYDESLICDVP